MHVFQMTGWFNPVIDVTFLSHKIRQLLAIRDSPDQHGRGHLHLERLGSSVVIIKFDIH